MNKALAKRRVVISLQIASVRGRRDVMGDLRKYKTFTRIWLHARSRELSTDNPEESRPYFLSPPPYEQCGSFD